jgi:hypothetical protein
MIISATITKEHAPEVVKSLAFKQIDNEETNIILLLSLFQSVVYELYGNEFRVEITKKSK